MVEYITYKGEKYPIRISWSSVKRNSQLENVYDMFEASLWYGLISGHVAENKELLLKREDVEFILDESLQEFKVILEKQMAKYNTAFQGEVDSKKK